jgi:hypothetical protein
VWRALGLNLGVFGLLFGLHIVFAARNMDAAFAMVAALISVQVVAFGPITALGASLESGTERRLALRRTTPLSLAMAIGLAWAYGGMAWSAPALVGVLGATLVVHGVADRRWTA